MPSNWKNDIKMRESEQIQKILLLVHGEKRLDLNFLKKFPDDLPREVISFTQIEELPDFQLDDTNTVIVYLASELKEADFEYLKKISEQNNSHFLILVTNQFNNRYNDFLSQNENILYFTIEEIETLSFMPAIRLIRYLIRSRKRVRSAQAGFRNLMRGSSDAVVSIDSKGKIIDFNDPLLDISKYGEQEILDQPFKFLFPALDFNLITERNEPFETYLLSKDGELNPLQLTFVREESGAQDNYHIICHNISQFIENEKLNWQFQNQLLVFKNLLDSYLSGSPNQSGLASIFKDIKSILHCDYLFLLSISETESGAQQLKHHFSFPDGASMEEVYLTALPKLETLTDPGFYTIPMKVGVPYTGLFIPFKIKKPVKDQLMLAIYSRQYHPTEQEVLVVRIFLQIYFAQRLWNQYLVETQQSRLYYQNLVEQAQDGIYQSTMDGRLLFANKALVKLLGYDSLKELKKLEISQALYVDPGQRQVFLEKLKSKNEVLNYAVNLKRKDGRIVSVIEAAHLVKHSKGEYIEGIIRDITDYEKVKQKVAAEKFFSDQLIEHASILIMAFDAKGDIVIWNKKAEEASGYSKKDIMENPDFLDLIFTDVGQFQERVLQAPRIEQEGQRIPVDLKLFTRIGEEKIIRWTSISLQTPEYPRLKVYFGLDITEYESIRKRLDKDRRDAEFREIADAVYTSFDRIVTNSISYLLDLKEYLIENKLDPENLNSFEQTLRNGSDFIRQLMLLSEKKNPQAEIIHLDDFVQNVIDNSIKLVPGNIHVNTFLKPGILVKGDSSKLAMALLNILRNSIESIGQEEGLVEIHTYLKKQGDFSTPVSVIEITDNGPGMAENILNQALNPFFTTKKDRDFRGLGLTIANKIIESHYGALELHSIPEQGARVLITLPAQEAEVEPSMEQIKNEMYTESRKPGKVLIVDDEMIIRDLLSDILATQGYSVLVAENGLVGLDIFKKQPSEIDMIILDIIMPEMNGHEFYFAVKKLKPDVKILLTSGFSKSNIKKELLDAGVDGYLPKPFTIKEVLEITEDIMKPVE